MNKLLLLFTFLLLLSKTNAQVVFCPAGAEWRYSFLENNIGTTHNEKISYTGDSILGNESVKVLRHVRFFKHVNNLNPRITFIKQKGDTIFMKNSFTQNSWQILYNFNVSPGDSWQNVIQSKTYTVVVTSVDYITVNNFPLKRLFVTYTSSSDGSSVQITERFGCNEFLFNFVDPASADGDYLQDFLCYKDNVFGQEQFTAKSCEFANLAGLTSNTLENNFVNIFPNPTNGKLTIKISDESIKELKISNALGQIVYAQEHLNFTENIDLSFLPSGIYYLSLNKQSQNTIKLIKK